MLHYIYMVRDILPGKCAVAVVIFVALVSAQSAQAMCVWGVVPANRIFEPVDATSAFLAYTDGKQIVIMQPEFKGNASEFAIIYPTPSRPEVTEGPVTLFEELNNATNPRVERNNIALQRAASVKNTSEQSVTVIEQKDVGDYTATVLTATNADDLVEWLEENRYNFTASDSEKVDYYVKQTGYYFIALKINMGVINLKERDLFNGELKPIQFTFKTDKPQLPMRTLKSDMERMTFDLYTLGNRPLYIPGIDTVWSNIVNEDFLRQVPSLNEYAPKGKWLLRQEVTFRPQNSDEDVFLSVGEQDFATARPSNQIIIRPQDRNPETGILPGQRGRIAHGYTFVRNIFFGSTGEDVFQLQKVLNGLGFQVADNDAGSPGKETFYFGPKTKQAVIRYQNFYKKEILKPINLSTGTGFFGPRTRNHINEYR